MTQIKEINIENYIEQNINRIEIIGTEREYVKYGNFSASIQDNGQTLKIFIKNLIGKK